MPKPGEQHHNAKLSDKDVDQIRELHEQHGLGYRTIANKFEVHPSTIRDILQYKSRYATVYRTYEAERPGQLPKPGLHIERIEGKGNERQNTEEK